MDSFKTAFNRTLDDIYNNCKHFLTNLWIEFPHKNLNKFLLKFFGLWPYSNRIIKRRNYMIFVIWTVINSIILIEGLMEMTMWDTMAFYGTIGSLMWVIISLILATALYMKEQSLKELHDQMELIWQTTDDAQEIAIMKSFTRRATSMTAIYTGTLIVNIAVFFVSNFLSVAYKDTSHYSKSLSAVPERWVFHSDLKGLQTAVHYILIACYAGLLYIAALHVYLNSVMHTCALFAIVSHRLRKLGYRRNIILIINEARGNDEVTSDLIDIVAQHRKAIRSYKNIENTFNWILYFLQLIGMILESVYILGMKLSFSSRGVHLIFRSAPRAVNILIYGFFLNYGGQQIIKFSNQVFIDTCYSTSWDSMSPKLRKLILMLMLRSSKDVKLKAGLMTLCLQNLTQLIKISWSLGTMLFSSQSNLNE